MDLTGLLRAVFALAVVLGLIMALAYILKRYAPQLMAQLQAKRGEKRLSVVETLVLDPARRLVLVRLDGEERLILLGEGQELTGQGKQAVLPVSQPAEPEIVERPVERPMPRPVPAAVAPLERPAATQPAPARPKIALASTPKPKLQDPNDDLF